ncbi:MULTISPECIES: CaiB/BaiF CoA-transferase family protein [unclassified Parafrankia]|uniref:CaiB/BaiF CoA transferase family protein n=1 Tax=unclassified Parafrankia TaxID=2994368 RepID=UPI000DA5AB1F|nr:MULTISPECIES: CaiB/BaiF CoA-transferase family protein [unclassified Parafrankia]TCJ31411.1 CoA transferase [Parafrankia sp. BMG5.11]SQD95578.1 L-carnitine dehydratase/bile acid-inducible protein F [Parafrankia sp. Ea1.12]
MSPPVGSGPLAGTRVLEIAARGPGPFAGMLLADMGAEILRIDRPDPPVRPQAPDHRLELYNRGRRSVVVDLKHGAGPEVVLRLVERADAIYEGYRPGVAERLGIGPDACLQRNPRIVYGRGTGWGQTGPLADKAGHDINYIALAGALDPLGYAGGPPAIPLNLIGDYAGGGMMLAFGIVCALLEARGSGRGQVVDAAMVDGASLLMTLYHGRRMMGTWSDERGTNYVDSGAPFYNVYETSDHRYVAIGAIEPKFQRVLFDAIGVDLDGITMPVSTIDRTDWAELRRRLATVFATRTRDEWTKLLADVDGCYSPVLSLGEVSAHPHHQARDGFPELDGIPHPAPAPRFGRTPAAIRTAPPRPGEHTREALADWGFTDDELQTLHRDGAIR